MFDNGLTFQLKFKVLISRIFPENYVAHVLIRLMYLITPGIHVSDINMNMENEQKLTSHSALGTDDTKVGLDMHWLR